MSHVEISLNTLSWIPPHEPGAARAFVLALLMHSLLFALLYFGMHWRNQTPVAVEAELWSALPQKMAPAPSVAPDTPVNARPEKILKSDMKPTPPVVSAVVPKTPPRNADIVLKRKQREKEKRLEAEQRAEALRLKEEKRALRLQAQQEENRTKELQRLLSSAASAPSNHEHSGTAAQTSGPSSEWSGVVAAAIKANINYSVPSHLKGHPRAEFLIRLLPSGEIMGAPKLLRSSGIRAYDEAVERAIRKTDPLPRPKNGIFSRELTLEFNPREER